MMKNYPLSYPVKTVNFDGTLIRKLPKEMYLERLEVLKSLEIDEIMLSGYVMVEKADFDMGEETKRVGTLLDSLGMRPAQHHGLAAVYAPLEFSQEPVVDNLIQEIRYTANLNSPILVIHPGNYHDDDSWNRHITVQEIFERQVENYGLAAVLSTAAENLREAGREAQSLGVKIAIENVDRFEPMGDSSLLPRLIKETDSPAVGYCLDAGHAHCCGQTPVTSWMDIMGSKLFTTHFHDNRGARRQALSRERWISPSGIDEHRAPGFGTIPWLDVIEKLREIGYRNTVNFESDGWKGMPLEEGYRCAISFWRALEELSEEKE